MNPTPLLAALATPLVAPAASRATAGQAAEGDSSGPPFARALNDARQAAQPSREPSAAPREADAGTRAERAGRAERNVRDERSQRAERDAPDEQRGRSAAGDDGETPSRTAGATARRGAPAGRSAAQASSRRNLTGHDSAAATEARAAQARARRTVVSADEAQDRGDGLRTTGDTSRDTPVVAAAEADALLRQQALAGERAELLAALRGGHVGPARDAADITADTSADAASPRAALRAGAARARPGPSGRGSRDGRDGSEGSDGAGGASRVDGSDTPGKLRAAASASRRAGDAGVAGGAIDPSALGMRAATAAALAFAAAGREPANEGEAGLPALAGPAGAAAAALPAGALPGTFGTALGTAAAAGATDVREAGVAAPPGSEGFARELGAQVSIFVREGVQQARLHLNPQELGPVHVRIHLEGQAAQVHMAADMPLTRQALEQALPMLASQLSESGITLAGGGVFEQAAQDFAERRANAGDARGDFDEGRFKRETAAGGVATPGRWTPARGLVDLIA